MTVQFRIPGHFTAPNLPDLGLLGFTDTFTRPDAASLGATEDPARPWIIWPSATVGGVANYEGYAARSGSPGPTAATADAGTGDGTISVTLGAIVENQSGVVFRASSLNDYYRYTQVQGASWRLERVAGGTTTVIETVSAATPTPGAVMSVILDGDSIICQVNGSTVITHADSHNATATRHGFYNSGSATQTVRDVTFTA